MVGLGDGDFCARVVLQFAAEAPRPAVCATYIQGLQFATATVGRSDDAGCRMDGSALINAGLVLLHRKVSGATCGGSDGRARVVQAADPSTILL